MYAEYDPLTLQQWNLGRSCCLTSLLCGCTLIVRCVQWIVITLKETEMLARIVMSWFQNALSSNYCLLKFAAWSQLDCFSTKLWQMISQHILALSPHLRIQKKKQISSCVYFSLHFKHFFVVRLGDNQPCNIFTGQIYISHSFRVSWMWNFWWINFLLG